MRFGPAVAFLIASTLIPLAARAQEGYEFEVYGGERPARGATVLEFHLNFVPSSNTLGEEDRRPSDHAFRSSVELAIGLSSWLEGSIYATGYGRNGDGMQFVGNRLRLTAIAPVSWYLPFDLGFTAEAGYARRTFAENRWTVELAPTIGKRFGRVSVLLNPAIERGLGKGSDHEVEFEPRARLGFTIEKDEGLALEYYGVAGPIKAFDPKGHQRHQVFAIWNSDLLPHLDTAFGIGRGLTKSSDRWTLMTRIEIETKP